MPNRIIKESICTSDSLDALSWFEEVLFCRLIVNCDDYGRFDGRIAVIKNRLFPLKDTLTAKAVEDGINKLAMVGLVRLYECDNKPYLFLPTWNDHQNVRAKRSKYPEPVNIVNASACKCNQVQENVPDIQSNPILSESLSVSESETEAADGKPSCQHVVDMYHSICISFPSVRSLSDARKKAIKARLKNYTLDDFKTVFENAEASSFLKGADGGWKASFDWLIKEANMLKVMEGNYVDKPQRYGRQERKPNWMQPSLEMGQAEIDAIKQLMGTVTVEDNPAVAEEAEAMQQKMREKYGRKQA